jgi:hypothetical protein
MSLSDENIVKLNEPVNDMFGVVAFECPHCGIIPIKDAKISTNCKHIVFTYDWTNGEYVDISPLFKKYFKIIFEEQNITSVIDENDQDYIDDFIYEGIIPHPEILRQYIQDLNLYEIYSVDGGHGFVLGHASEKLLTSINKLNI